MTPQLKPIGDCALSISFGQTISPDIHRLVRAFQTSLEQQKLPGILETVPAYCTVTIHYDPVRVSFASLCSYAEHLLETMDQVQLPPSMVYEIPVCYGGNMGPDLPHVADYSHLSEQDVIQIHTAPDYLIYMLGFTPGFPYLGGMNPAIATPRLSSPRVSIPAGSVGIAGRQTGIYPLASPGGWNLIGQTPVRLFDPHRNQPFLLQPGDYIRFRSISLDEFYAIARQVEGGHFQCPCYQNQEMDL